MFSVRCRFGCLLMVVIMFCVFSLLGIIIWYSMVSRVKLNIMLVISVVILVCIGVLVFWWVQKVGSIIFSRVNVGRLKFRLYIDSVVMWVLKVLNWLCWKMVVISGLVSSSRFSMVGIEISRVMCRFQFSECEKFLWLVLIWWWVSVGRIIVFRVMLNMFSGSFRKWLVSDSQDCELLVSLVVIIVFSSRLICVIEELNRVGIISVIILCMFGWCQFQCGRVSRLMFFSEGSWNSNCRMLVVSIVQFSVRICFFGVLFSRGVSYSVLVIMYRLRMIGVSVGIVKCWKLFSVLLVSVVSEMNSRNGKVRWNRLISRFCLIGLVLMLLEKIEVSCGVKIRVSVVISISILFRVLVVWVISLCSLVWLWVFFIFVNIGMKVVVKDFLVNNWCRKLGILKVIQKVLVMVLVLNVVVIMKFWISLRMCEIMVMLLNDSRFCNNLGEFIQCFF